MTSGNHVAWQETPPRVPHCTALEMPTILPGVHSQEGDVAFTCNREVPGARISNRDTGMDAGGALGHLQKPLELPAQPGAAGGVGPRSETPLGRRRERGCDH